MICARSSPCGDGAGEGENHRNEEFLRYREGKFVNFRSPRDVDRCEVGQGSGGQHRVACTRGQRHGMKNQNNRDHRGNHGQRNEDSAVLPVEMVASAQGRAGVSRIEQAVRDIKGPGGEAENDRKPNRQAHMGRPGKSKSPGNGYGGRVEARQMPEPQWRGCVEL